MEMTLNLFDRQFSVTFIEAESEPSLATGQELRRRQIGLVAGEALVGDLISRLSDARRDGLTPEPLVEEEGTAWLVEDFDYDYSVKTEGTTFEITLVEVTEIPSVQSVRIGELDPFEVRWSSFDPTDDVPCWLLEAVVPADVAGQVDALHADRIYFDVTLEGVREDTVRARTGRVAWQALDGGSRIYHLILVCDEGRPEDPAFVSHDEIQLENVTKSAGIDHETLVGIVDALVAAGHLTQDQVDQIRETAQAQAQVSWTRAHEVSDITVLR